MARSYADSGFAALVLDYCRETGGASSGSEEKLGKWEEWRGAVRAAAAYLLSRPRIDKGVLIQGAPSISLWGDDLCRPKLVVGGKGVLRGGREAAVLDEVVTPFEISAIEVYRGPGEIPLQFGGLRSPCGPILI